MFEQLSLFSEVAPGPNGLRYQPDFISERDERELVVQISSLPLEPFQFGAFVGKRRVASFGWRYDYGQQKLKEAEDLPTWITPVVARSDLGEPPSRSNSASALHRIRHRHWNWLASRQTALRSGFRPVSPLSLHVPISPQDGRRLGTPYSPSRTVFALPHCR